MGVYHGFETNKTATMFFLKKPFLVSTAQTDLGLRSRNSSLRVLSGNMQILVPAFLFYSGMHFRESLISSNMFPYLVIGFCHGTVITHQNYTTSLINLFYYNFWVVLQF